MINQGFSTSYIRFVSVQVSHCSNQYFTKFLNYKGI